MYTIILLSVSAVMISEINYVIAFLVITILCCVPYLRGPHSHNIFYHSYGVCLDKLSTFLIILTLWIRILMLLAMKNAQNLKFLILSITSLNVILVLRFMSSNMFCFFIFFELSLIPTLYIILGWGIQPERMQAGSYLMIYTLCGALPFLGSLLYLYHHDGVLSIYLPRLKNVLFFSSRDYSFYCFFWILAFLIKLPIYGVHLWLPKAHVEAPVAGSMVLAGVLLKLGAYGLLRSLRFLDLDLCYWRKLLFIWSIFTMCLVGLICFRQSDLKSLVAYSSVAHMSLVLAACFTCDVVGYKGIMCMLVSHGLCSSGLFFGVQCLYEKRGTRKIYLNRGLINICPTFVFFWFLLCVGKASAPPSLNLLREFFLFSSIILFGGGLAALFCGLSVFLGGLFRAYLYVSVCHGKWRLSRNYWGCITHRDALILLLHVVPLYGLVFLRNKYVFVS